MNEISPSLTCCFLYVRKIKVSWVSLVRKTSGMMVLNAELKSTNRILAYVPWGVEVLRDVVQSHVDYIIH